MRNMWRRAWNGMALTATAALLVRLEETRRALVTPSISPHPIGSYSEAVARVQLMHALEEGGVRPGCGTLLHGHGQQTDEVYVLLHGFTNCPKQFEQLAQRIFDGGANVLVPRMTYHGLPDRTAVALSALTVTDLVAVAHEAIDVAHGLGKRVVLVGFSLGGLIAAWLAHNRGDLERAVIISAPFAVHTLSTNRIGLGALLYRLLPNRFEWWDPDARDARTGPVHAYPRYPRHAMAMLMALAAQTMRAARQRAPRTGDVRIILNPTDEAVASSGMEELAYAWAQHGFRTQRYTFDAEWGLRHDVVDPLQEFQQIERVYPLLMKWIGAESSPVEIAQVNPAV